MFHKLFDCARGHGKFVRVSELRNYEDFYKMEVEMKIGKSNSNEESQLLDTTEKTNQGMHWSFDDLIHDNVRFGICKVVVFSNRI